MTPRDRGRPDQPADRTPRAPDGSELTAEEWAAVRRLRGEAGGRRTAPRAGAGPAAAAPAVPAEPATVLPERRPRAARRPPGASPAAGFGRTVAAPRSVATLAVVALTVVALVSVVLGVLVTVRASDRQSQARAGTAALAAATTGVASVLSYNYRSLAADFSRAEALLTPAFRKTYEATTAKAVRPLAAKYKAVSTAQVSAGGVISASASRATVLVFVSQQVTNTQLGAPRLDRSRIQVWLVKLSGKWLIDKLDPV